MQASDDAPLAAAVEARTRRPLFRVRADWEGDGAYGHPNADLTGMVAGVEVERALTTDVPAEAGLVDGYVSAQATVELEGAATPTGVRAADLFAPYNEDSPLYSNRKVGRNLQVDMGMATSAGPRLLRQHTGPVRSISPNHGTRRVKLEALDPSERLRALITMPVGCINGPAYKEDPGGYPWLTNSQWVIDYVLRRNGIYASPPPNPASIFSATLHGSHVAEIAAQTFAPRSEDARRARAYAGEWYRSDGHPFGMLYPVGDWVNSPMVMHVTNDVIIPTENTGIGWSGWVYCGDGLADEIDTSAGPNRVLARFSLGPDDRMEVILFSDGRMGVTYSCPDGATTLAPSLGDAGPVGWKFVGAWVQWLAPGQMQFYLRIEGATWSFLSPASRAWESFGGLHPRTRAEIWYPSPQTNISMWWGETPPLDGQPWPGELHAAQASIDRGLNEVTHLPEVVGEDSWSLLQDVVGTEYGIVGFDEWGAPFFRARGSVASDTSSIEKIYSVDVSIKDLVTEVSTDSVRNVIGWEAGSAFVNDNRYVVAYEAETYYQFNVIPGITVFEVPVPPMMLVPEEYEVPQWAAVDWEALGNDIVWGYVAYFPTGQGEVPGNEVNVYWSLIAPRVGQLTIENLSPRRFELRLPNDDQGNPGEPALRLYGLPIEPEPRIVGERVRRGSLAVYGERGYKMADTPWRQLDGPTRTVASSLLATLANPLPIIEDVEVIGDPRVQLGDTVRLRDRHRMEVLATVVKVRRRLDGSGLADRIAVRPIAPPRFGLLDDERRGRADTTLILAP